MDGVQNILWDQSIVQLLYNLIHWFVGFNLVLYASLEYYRTHHKPKSKLLTWLGPAFFAFNGIFFVAYTLGGHVIYLNYFNLPWQFDPEHKIHVAIGGALALGGLVQLLQRRERLKRHFWQYGPAVSLIVSGLLFLHPQHGSGDVLEYMTIYHQILAGSLILGGVALAIARIKPATILATLALFIVTMPGFTFLAYRHQYNTEAACRAPGKVHTMKLYDDRIEPESLKVTLCDSVRFVVEGNKPHALMFGKGQHQHDNYSSYSSRQLKTGEEQTFIADTSGTFTLHDHPSADIKGTLVVERPSDLTGWTVRNY